MFLGRSKPKGLNRVAKDYLCRMKIGVTLNPLHHLGAVNFNKQYKSNKPCQCQSTWGLIFKQKRYRSSDDIYLRSHGMFLA